MSIAPCGGRVGRRGRRSISVGPIARIFASTVLVEPWPGFSPEAAGQRLNNRLFGARYGRNRRTHEGQSPREHRAVSRWQHLVRQRTRVWSKTLRSAAGFRNVPQTWRHDCGADRNPVERREGTGRGDAVLLQSREKLRRVLRHRERSLADRKHGEPHGWLRLQNTSRVSMRRKPSKPGGTARAERA
jgi:hypothetical protein